MTILASFRYRTDHGEHPASLDDLVRTGYLSRVSRDSFSKDNSLIHKRTAGDFLLYSHGLDFGDGGGTPHRRGHGEKGGDQVFWPVTDPE